MLICTAGPLAAVDLHRRAERKLCAARAEEGRAGAVVDAEVEVDVCACEKRIRLLACRFLIKAFASEIYTLRRGSDKCRKDQEDPSPSEFIPSSPLCEQSGFPSAGHRLLILTTTVLAPLSGFPELSVCGVSCQHPPQAGPAPAPGPTPKRFWETAALKPGLSKKPQAVVATLQFPEPKVSPAP